MKYEEIKVGEAYRNNSFLETVISKSDQYKAVMTVDENGAFNGWSVEELESFQPIKKELPETGLLVHGSDTIVYRTGEISGFGFNAVGNYENIDIWSFNCSPGEWRTATPQDEAKFIKLLEAEAEKRGLGVDAKIKGHADGDHEAFNEYLHTPHFTTVCGWNKNGCIFHNGIWAEPLTMLDEVTEVIKKHLPNIVVEMTDGVVTLKQL